MVQACRSRDVAMPTEYTPRLRDHCVYVSTYVPSGPSTMRGSSTPPGLSRSSCASFAGYNTGCGSRVKCRPSLLLASPSREVWPPIISVPESSSAR